VPGEFEGKPDTAVLTGDIAAMWLRDSSAQVWPYLPLAAKDTALRQLLEGVIRRQTRCILIDPYANAFMADLNAPSLPWSVKDLTDMKPGVGERKWEIDSLCYPMRLAVDTLRVQQRRRGVGPPLSAFINGVYGDAASGWLWQSDSSGGADCFGISAI
jgi:uncharacterized protein